MNDRPSLTSPFLIVHDFVFHLYLRLGSLLAVTEELNRRGQKTKSWTTKNVSMMRAIEERYDDGGFSGANTDRPGFQRLMCDIQEGKVDVVAVYKIDRLSRSLLDFARIMDTFERRGVSFVSVTQQFNTTTPMGQLMLNILMSFAH